jgi:hypothetical protein
MKKKFFGNIGLILAPHTDQPEKSCLTSFETNSQLIVEGKKKISIWTLYCTISDRIVDTSNSLKIGHW